MFCHNLFVSLNFIVQEKHCHIYVVFKALLSVLIKKMLLNVKALKTLRSCFTGNVKYKSNEVYNALIAVFAISISSSNFSYV